MKLTDEQVCYIVRKDMERTILDVTAAGLCHEPKVAKAARIIMEYNSTPKQYEKACERLEKRLRK
jgi:hypothetical protein